jgi:hypothetical protein
VGASSIQFYFGQSLEQWLDSRPNVEAHRVGKLGSGLARPDVFNWPRQLDQLVQKVRPGVVIAQLGGNDGQPLVLPNGKRARFGTEAWSAEYSRRVHHVVSRVRRSGACMVMLGMHVTRSTKLSDRLRQINAVTQWATVGAGGQYVDTWELAAAPSGMARASITHGGQTSAMYLADGVHYSRVGAAFVAEGLRKPLLAAVVLEGAGPQRQGRADAPGGR